MMSYYLSSLLPSESILVQLGAQDSTRVDRAASLRQKSGSGAYCSSLEHISLGSRIDSWGIMTNGLDIGHTQCYWPCPASEKCQVGVWRSAAYHFVLKRYFSFQIFVLCTILEMASNDRVGWIPNPHSWGTVSLVTSCVFDTWSLRLLRIVF